MSEMNGNRQLIAWVCAAAIMSFGASAFSQETSSQETSSQQRKSPDDVEKTAVSADHQARVLVAEAQELYQAGKWPQAKETYEKAYAAAPEDSHLKAQTALEWSSLLWEQGDYGQANERVADALKRARELDMTGAIGRLLLTQGHIEASQGKLRSAENTLKICIKLTTEQNDEVFEALCQLNHRLVRQIRGRPVGPETDYRKAIAKLEAAGTPLSVGSALAKTSELHAKNGDVPKALGLLMRAQKQFEKADSVPAQIRNRMRIGKLLQEHGRHAEARKYLDGLVAKFDAMNNRPALVDALVLSAQDAQFRGDFDQASRFYQRALGVAKQTKSPSLIARSHLAMCEFGTSTGKVAKVVDYCKTAAEQFDSLGIPKLAARSNAQLARLYHAKGQLNEASSKYSKVIQTLEKTGVPGTDDTPAIVEYRANLCQVETSLGSNGANYLCLKALKELESQSSPDPAMLAATHYAVGVTAGRDGWAGKGVDHLNRAAKVALTQTPPDRDLAADAMLRRGIILGNLGDRADEAVHDFKKGIAITLDDKADKLKTTRVQLRLQLAQIQLKGEDWKAAKQSIDKLIDDAKGDAKSQAWAYNGLARAELKLGNDNEAKIALDKGLPLAKKAGDKSLVSNFKENLEKFED
jgi:tetratricopeptide (TPR) repeat protein